MTRRCMGCMREYEGGAVCPYCGYREGTAPARSFHLRAGSVLGDRYIVGRELGYGGFGATYIGWDRKLDRIVAIKEYLPAEYVIRQPGDMRIIVFDREKSEHYRKGLEKFIREAHMLAKLDRIEGIVRLYDRFEANNTAYIVMEYLQGERLDEYLKRVGKIEPQKAISMILPVIDALGEVHKQGIIHRDIAPNNIFVSEKGTLKVFDFGAARCAATGSNLPLTVMVKYGYSPVEQYQREGRQGSFTDVYALAATLYTMITGQMPVNAIQRATSKADDLIPPRRLCSGLKANQETAILNALNIRAEDRTQTMEEFREELTRRPEGGGGGNKKRWIKALLSAAAVVLIAGLVLLTNKTLNNVSPGRGTTTAAASANYVSAAAAASTVSASATDSATVPSAVFTTQTAPVTAGTSGQKTTAVTTPTGRQTPQTFTGDMTVAYGDGWWLDRNGVLTVSRDCSEKDPEDYPWDRYRDDIREIVLTKTAAVIGEKAFYGCSALTGVRFFDGVKAIGDKAFGECGELTEIAIPSTVTSIGINPFYACHKLKRITVDAENPAFTAEDDVLFNRDKTMLVAAALTKSGKYVIPGTVEVIGEWAFGYCGQIREVTIPESMTSIEDWAFGECSGLEVVTMPRTMQKIGRGAFEICVKLRSFELPEGLSVIERETFNLCSSLTSVSIPDSIVTVSDWAFASCANLQEISIPESVTDIKKNAFSGCSGLNVVHYGGSPAAWDAISIADGNNSLRKADIRYDKEPNTASAIDIAQFLAGLDESIIDSGVCGAEGDGSNLFWKLDDSGTVTIQGTGRMADFDTDEFDHQGPWCVYGDRETASEGIKRSFISRVVIEPGAENVGSGAFQCCYALTSVQLPDTVTEIGDLAFRKCGSLSELTLPENLVSIGERAFTCIEVKELDCPASLRRIGDSAFYYSALVRIELPDAMEELGVNVFGKCIELETLKLPACVTKLSAGDFWECDSLAVLSLPASVSEIDPRAFENARIREIRVDPANPYFASRDGVLFNKDMTELIRYPDGRPDAEYTIPDTVRTIGEEAFFECGNLERLTIPLSVERIGPNMFGNDSSRPELIYAGTQEEWNKIRVDERNTILIYELYPWGN